MVNPWIHDFAAYNFWMEPVGLLSIGAILRENAYEVHLIDCIASAPPIKPKPYNTWKIPKTPLPKPSVLRGVPRIFGRYGISPDKLKRMLLSIPKPNLVMVTSKMTYWYTGVRETISLLREVVGDVPIVLGGTYATLCYKHAVGESGADLVVRGEGELEALRIADEITGNRSDHSGYDLMDLDTLPLPAHDLMPKRDGKLPYAALLTSRGCPMSCTYCASGLLFPRFRRRSPEGVLEEVERCHVELGVVDFAFYDDALLAEAEQHIIPILEGVISRGLRVRFHTPNGLHVRFITPELAELMRRAGFKTVRLGLETADEERMRETGGKASREEFVRAVAYLKRAGFTAEELGAYLLVGLPGQSVEEIERSARFVHSLGVQVRFAYFSPIPGTAEWKRAVEEFGFPPEADPLLHNNSLLIFLTPQERERFQRLKIMAERLNGELLGRGRSEVAS